MTVRTWHATSKWTLIWLALLLLIVPIVELKSADTDDFVEEEPSPNLSDNNLHEPSHEDDANGIMASIPVTQGDSERFPQIEPNSTCIARYFDGVRVRFKPRSNTEVLLLCRWIRRGNWESSTFRVFREFITRQTTYIGFGAWVGPMVLYAAHLTHNDLWVLEPDFEAYSALKINIRINSKMIKRIHAFHRCISDHVGVVNLFSRGFGASTSSMIEKAAMYIRPNTTFVDGPDTAYSTSSLPASSSFVTPADVFAAENGGSSGGGGGSLQTTPVSCTTLPLFIQSHQLRPPYFIKVDVEGYEQVIVPSWRNFLEQMANKTTIFLSMHQHVAGAFPPEAQRGMAEVFALFRFVFEVVEVSEGRQRPPFDYVRPRTNWELHHRLIDDSFVLCESCSYVLAARIPKRTFLLHVRWHPSVRKKYQIDDEFDPDQNDEEGPDDVLGGEGANPSGSLRPEEMTKEQLRKFRAGASERWERWRTRRRLQILETIRQQQASKKFEESLLGR